MMLNLANGFYKLVAFFSSGIAVVAASYVYTKVKSKKSVEETEPMECDIQEDPVNLIGYTMYTKGFNEETGAPQFIYAKQNKDYIYIECEYTEFGYEVLESAEFRFDKLDTPSDIMIRRSSDNVDINVIYNLLKMK